MLPARIVRKDFTSDGARVCDPQQGVSEKSAQSIQGFVLAALLRVTDPRSTYSAFGYEPRTFT
jgi:hypothetical protein